MSASGYNLLMHCGRTGDALRTTYFLRPEPDSNFYQIIRDIGCSFFIEADGTTQYRDNLMHLQLNGVTVATFNISNDGVRSHENGDWLIFESREYHLKFYVTVNDLFGPGRRYLSCPILTINDIK